MPEATLQPETRTRWKATPVFISSTFRDMHSERLREQQILKICLQ